MSMVGQIRHKRVVNGWPGQGQKYKSMSTAVWALIRKKEWPGQQKETKGYKKMIESQQCQVSRLAGKIGNIKGYTCEQWFEQQKEIQRAC